MLGAPTVTSLVKPSPTSLAILSKLTFRPASKNAVLRGGAQVPVRMSPKDFEVYRTEHMTRTATVVLLDQSRSMGLFNNFQAAKKVTLALMALIRTQYPRDTLYVIGFSDYAREIKENDLAKVSWNSWVSGTNLHHGLMLSRKLLSKEKGGSRQILLITDGEPTAHLEGDQAFFQLSAQLSHRTRDLQRSQAVHPGGHRYQYFHVGKLLPIGEFHRSLDQNQSR